MRCVRACGSYAVEVVCGSTGRAEHERAVVTTLAGNINAAYVDGSGSNTGFNFPYGVAVDASGNALVADIGNNRIRTVTADGGTRIGLVSSHALFFGLCRQSVGCSASPYVGVLFITCALRILSSSQLKETRDA
jgi:hypothetical protein